MPVRSAADKAKRQAEMKANQQVVQTAPVEVLPPPPSRDINGRFAKGHRLRLPGCGRPRDQFAEMARHYVDKYQLLQAAAEMAAGVGRYRKGVDAATRLRAIEFVVERAFGKASAVVELEVDRQVMIRRIVGVNDSDI